MSESRDEIYLQTKIRERVKACGGRRTKEQFEMLKDEVAWDIAERFRGNSEEIAKRLATYYIASVDSIEGYYSANGGSCEKVLLDEARVNELADIICIKNREEMSYKQKKEAIMKYMEEQYPGEIEFYQDDEGNLVYRESILIS